MSALNPTGIPTVWAVNQNGFDASLRIDSVDNSGQVRGSIEDSNGNLMLQTASWDEQTRRLIFTRSLPNGENQTFTGYLFGGQDTAGHSYAIAGTFRADRFESTPDFGWYALGDDVISP